MPEAGEDDLPVSHCVDFPLWQRIYSHRASATSIFAKGLALVPLIPLLSTRNHPRWTFVTPPPDPRTPAFPRLKHLHLSVEGFDDVHRGVCICLVRRTGYYGQNMVHIINRYFEVVRDSLASRANLEYAIAGRATHSKLSAPKLKSLSMMVKVWDVHVTEEDKSRFKETYKELFAPIAEVVRPLDLCVRKSRMTASGRVQI